ncbi:MAG: hypothetical protein O3A92_08795 [Verrucomicrobia bacterium]|nr:hypothetical protein [Verrucomicrobiota bacterium]
MKKKKRRQLDKRMPPELIREPLRKEHMKRFREALHADPTLELMGFSFSFAAIATGTATEEEREAASRTLLRILAPDYPAAAAASIFADLAKMKMRLAEKPHRLSRAYAAYEKFIDETNRQPSKIELKDYILNRPQQYGTDWPGREEPWTRIWDGCCLSELGKEREGLKEWIKLRDEALEHKRQREEDRG